MMLTPVTPARLPVLAAQFRASIAGDPLAEAAFACILASTPPDLSAPADTAAHRAQAVALIESFGIAVAHTDPAEGWSWDGRAIAVVSEASVTIHELAHYQVCAPGRRFLIDFGLGAGPESGRRAEADAQKALDGLWGEREESLASLLGILWEAELGQPALYAFLEQNWFEGAERAANGRHFRNICRLLHEIGCIDAAARPQYALRIAGEEWPGPFEGEADLAA
ncbi:MAG TPA: hypothetical protein VEH84_04125 [Alphaproteobacteria bacterium]|nr:hypothetical protein [Alphaproteobacteria bacterium]